MVLFKSKYEKKVLAKKKFFTPLFIYPIKKETLNSQVRKNNKYSNWRTLVFKRDSFTCQHCYTRGIYIEAHHIFPLQLILIDNNIKNIYQAEHCRQLWDVRNGITLCKHCHDKITYQAKRYK